MKNGVGWKAGWCGVGLGWGCGWVGRGRGRACRNSETRLVLELTRRQVYGKLTNLPAFGRVTEFLYSRKARAALLARALA